MKFGWPKIAIFTAQENHDLQSIGRTVEPRGPELERTWSSFRSSLRWAGMPRRFPLEAVLKNLPNTPSFDWAAGPVSEESAEYIGGIRSFFHLITNVTSATLYDVFITGVRTLSA